MEFPSLMRHANPRVLPQSLGFLFWVVDLGFIAYWAVTAFHLIPEEFLFQDYRNPVLVAWNWSFLPLDLLVSATGLWSVVLSRRGDIRAVRWAIASLALTSASGFQAISFWAFRAEFDWAWWAPNLFLLVYPWWFLAKYLREGPDRGVPLAT